MDVIPFQSSHTSENIQNIVKDSFIRHSNKSSLLFPVVSDCASNMQNAFANHPKFQCMCHRLNTSFYHAI